MTNNGLYNYSEVTSAIYYDVIDLMGEDGLEAKLTAYDLLAVMAAPCTRLDYDNTDPNRRTALMIAVHMFLKKNNRITNLTHRGLVAELNRSFLPTLSDEQQMKLLTSFKMVMGFDADGYAVFNKKFYDVYKSNLDKGTVTRIRYNSFSGNNVLNGLPDKEITRTYQVVKENGVYHVEPEISVNDWIDILRGASTKAMQLIGAFAKMEDHKATNVEIEDKFGINSDSINGVTAGLGNRAKRIMGIEVFNTDGTGCCWGLPFNNGYVESGRGFI